MTPSPLTPIQVYDTTLRDGVQGKGLSLSLDDKLAIARRLDRFGIPFIEGGWPGANPKDVQFFWKLQEDPLTQASVVAFCSTRRPGHAASDEAMLQPILRAGTQWVTIFGKSWDLQVTEVLRTTLDENLAMIQDTITFLRGHGRRVIYDAEHWFDGYKQDAPYALQTLEVAIAAGAEWLVLCDTNGGTLPHEVSAIVQTVVKTLRIDPNPDSGCLKLPQVGIHTHNDSGTAVANALAAVRTGARMVQGTINGYGERCGNANLCSLIPNLQLKLGYPCLQPSQLEHLTQVSHFVSEVANLAPDDHAPFVGLSAFAHKGGIHVSAVQRNPISYEHIQPEAVGNSRGIVISDQAGISNVLAKARSFGIQLERSDPACQQILQHLKTLENQGYQFEVAEASFELLMRQVLGQQLQFFELEGFQVNSYRIQGDAVTHSSALATVKLGVNSHHILEVAEGNGPVSALDAALRKALVTFYPAVESFHLTDYKVRILDGNAGTEAKTRVLVECSNGIQRWTTVGVSTNILEASYQALVEGIEYGLLLQDRARTALERAPQTVP